MLHSPSSHACHPSRSAVRASGLPGLRVVASPVSWQRRIAWLLAWLTLSALMAVDLHAVVSDFLRFDDVVSMSVREPARATFPAVTVCNLNSVRRSVMCSDNDAQPLLHTAHFAYWRKRLCQNATHRNIAVRTVLRFRGVGAAAVCTPGSASRFGTDGGLKWNDCEAYQSESSSNFDTKCKTRKS
ncbi:hypothetical protein HPB48_016147 [Haemaphysalis longicornis]|uniref:Uncharacterized protein n=1 Tax=Haemaphysalis longicornis TaxID=44386 RepID=A0A9J6GEM4_HAELO|nr:hypothetical protein HPB48_016147 [Haemaphysalis longicornis]